VIQDSKLATGGGNEVIGAARRAPFSFEFRWHGFTGDEAPQLVFAQLSKPVQVPDLFFQVVIRTVEPVSPAGSSMNAKRPANGVPEFSCAQLVVPWEDFDTLGQAEAFDSHPEFQRQVVDVYPALAGQGWSLHENPKVTAPPAHFKGRLDLVLLE